MLRISSQEIILGKELVPKSKITERILEIIDTGFDTSQNGNVVTTTNYYYDKDFFVDHSDRLEKFITIGKDGETEKIMMKNKLLGNCSWF